MSATQDAASPPPLIGNEWTRRAFERLIQLAVDRRVDFVLIAGDLYDGDWRDYNTGLYAVAIRSLVRRARNRNRP